MTSPPERATPRRCSDARRVPPRRRSDTLPAARRHVSEALRPAARYDVAVIGAGPAGTTTAALLEASGLDVAIFERARFPRFSIGESLLPVCNDVLHEAKLFDLVEAQ